MLRRSLFGLAVLAACGHDVEDGLFSPTGSPVTVTTVASGGNQGDESTDEGRAESGESSSGEDTSPATAATTAPNSATNTDPSAADTGTDPTFGPSDSSSDGGVDPTGVDPTGVDPTGVDPTGGAGACCEVQVGPGCGDAGVEACVCGLDDYCCSTQWDDVCVGEASDCGAGCAGGGGGAGDCCAAQLVPGCGDAAVEACVCGLDDFCCSVAWDDACVLTAVDCGAAC